MCTFQNGQPCRVMRESDRVTRQACILPCVLKGHIPQVKHFHFFVGSVDAGSLEETTEAKGTSTGHETSQRHRGREDREQRKKIRGRDVPPHRLCNQEHTHHQAVRPVRGRQ